MLWLVLACTRPADVPTDLAPPAGTGDTADTGTPPVDELVVLSLNLHCLKLDGTPFADNPARMAHVAAFVADHEVDALLLQEVCDGDEDATGLLQQALTDATGVVFGNSWAYAHDAWVGTADEAREGLAIFTRGEVDLAMPFDFVSPGVLRRVGVVRRLVGGPTLVSVHLDYDDELAREDQARQAASWGLAIGGVDALIAGDLNARIGEPPHQALLDQGYEDATAGLPAGHIDHLLVHQNTT